MIKQATTGADLVVVAGEVSGDRLGAGLIRELKVQHPDLVVHGVAGPLMVAAGCECLFPMQDLAVMGLVDVLKQLPRLLLRRWQLLRYLKKYPPKLYVGVDAPDFNLGIELRLKSRGIKTLHYISPTIWAWRYGRIHKIARAVDEILCILPFEPALYAKQDVKASFVGHPLANCLPMQVDKHAVKQRLGLSIERPVLALLPGSRRQEVEQMSMLMLQTAALCVAKQPHLQIVVPFIDSKAANYFAQINAKSCNLTYQSYLGGAQDVLLAAEVAAVTSGTATLEAMFCKTPMVIAYKTSWLNYTIGKSMLRTPYIGLPNILANDALVPELIQQAATPVALAGVLLDYLASPPKAILATFTRLHQDLLCDTDLRAASVAAKLMQLPVRDVGGGAYA